MWSNVQVGTWTQLNCKMLNFSLNSLRMDGDLPKGTASIRIGSAKVPLESSDLRSTARPGRLIMPRLCQKLMNTFAKIKLLGNCAQIHQTAQQQHTITGEIWLYSKRNQLRVHWCVLSQSTLALAATSMFSPSQGLLILCQNEQLLEAFSGIVLRKPSLIRMYGNEWT